MKIAFTTAGESLEAALDSRFGRAPKFLIYETDDGSYIIIDNEQNLNAAQGAGIQAAQSVIKAGALAVVTGHCGPKAFKVLSAGGVTIYNSTAPTIISALVEYTNGKLAPLSSANAEAHW
ncbi:MAG: dinitrogenase iron-molybdenum cofactor biosynthesis protein [Deltaproteobacteria bacterium]|nr:dinitrogenase iron-molybdenum cofactor biosynthesis protein [Deltaproteobacteria bacterium]